MANGLAEVLDANARYAAVFGEKGNLPLPPAPHFAILMCTDAHLTLETRGSGRGRRPCDPQRRRTLHA